MFPVIFSLGSISVSSFGVFLAVSFFVAVFLSWRLSRAYDLNEEKILDLVILTFIASIIGARVYFIIFNFHFFDSPEKIFLLNRYPGLSFWGGLLAGVAALKYFSAKFKLNFWQISDFAAVALLAGLIIGDIGCFFGGCSYGNVSSLPIAFPVVGLIGKRFPIALIESLLFLIPFFYVWKQVLRFHFTGEISSTFLIILGLVKFITEFYRGDSRQIVQTVGVSWGHLWALLTFVLGVYFFYRRSKRSLSLDSANFVRIFVSSKARKAGFTYLKKSYYNRKVDCKIKFGQMLLSLKGWPKILKRRLNVRSNPKNII